MKKIIVFSITVLGFVLSCQKDDNLTDITIENQSLNKKTYKSNAQTSEKGDITKIGVSDGSAITHDDFTFEYADGYDSTNSTTDFVYKLLKIQFYKGTTAQEKWELKEKYAKDLYGWEIFYVEDCLINENIQFWSIRIDKNLFDTLPPLGLGDNGESRDPVGELDKDDENICAVEETTLIEKDCDDVREENK